MQYMLTSSKNVASTFREQQLASRVRELEAYVEELERIALLKSTNEPPRFTLAKLHEAIAKEKPF